MYLRKLLTSAALAALSGSAFAQSQAGVAPLDDPGRDLYEKDLSSCPGYKATKHWETKSGFYADLSLAGQACNVYGTDLPDLKLEVEYQTEDRLHVKILDTNNTVYQVPDEVFPRPGFGEWCSPKDSKLKFNFNADPFSFTVSRTNTGEVLFNTTGNKLVFESQYVYLKTHLPQNPHLYGLGEHSDSFMLNTTNYTRTIYTRDAYGTPQGENLYGAHPIYFEHRENGTHGVFLLNSNGMDIYIDNKGGQYLEYNIIGGVLDFYFIAGPSPRDVATQYAEITQLPLMTPYWGLGFHQCKYGYQDVYEVAAVTANYSNNNIPLETIWTDIDYMDRRRIFTIDPERFPANLYKDLVDTIHARDQHYIVMVDPAVFYKESNPALDAGIEQDAFMKEVNGSFHQGVVWAGPSYFPDWFHPNAQAYWTEQFLNFFDGENGPDIDALWIDMNEPANFYNRPYPGNNTTPENFAEVDGDPPEAPPVRDGPDAPIPGFPASLQPNFASDQSTNERRSAVQSTIKEAAAVAAPRGTRRNAGAGNWRLNKRTVDAKAGWQNGKQTGSGCGPNECKGLPNRELIRPPYMIQNGAGPTLADSTADTDVVQSGGYVQYDTHNLYGAMMSTHSHNAMRARRPDNRALVITRSTFAGSGKDVSHWLGDNESGWLWYRLSISQILQFASLYQIPVVGPDVCGFGGNTTENLCARWASLGSFYTFFRNHAEITSTSQEFYRWPSVAEAARKGISIRYQLLDYIYTAIYRQNQTGLPTLNPLFFNYPQDSNTYPIDMQFFYGDGILVSPVTEENSTSLSYYLPDDIFYEWGTGKPVLGQGEYISAEVDLTDITVHYKGGVIVPQRIESANTTTALRTKGFNIVVAVGLDGSAEGSLYLDDGESIEQDAVSEIDFVYKDGELSMSGLFEYEAGVGIEMVTVLGVESEPQGLQGEYEYEYDAQNKKVVIHVDVPLTGEWEAMIA
ncbi:glycosyl hydrolases family 31-domain-containing protein [Aspergillus venezuelensis]